MYNRRGLPSLYNNFYSTDRRIKYQTENTGREAHREALEFTDDYPVSGTRSIGLSLFPAVPGRKRISTHDPNNGNLVKVSKKSGNQLSQIPRLTFSCTMWSLVQQFYNDGRFNWSFSHKLPRTGPSCNKGRELVCSDPRSYPSKVLENDVSIYLAQTWAIPNILPKYVFRWTVRLGHYEVQYRQLVRISFFMFFENIREMFSTDNYPKWRPYSKILIFHWKH